MFDGQYLKTPLRHPGVWNGVLKPAGLAGLQCRSGTTEGTAAYSRKYRCVVGKYDASVLLHCFLLQMMRMERPLWSCVVSMSTDD